MEKSKQNIFIAIVTNAGGEGKTLLAQVFQALLKIGGRSVEVLDGDHGNLAAKVADQDAKVLGWGVQKSKAPDIVAATRGSDVILDLGANSLASNREIVELLPALRDEYAAAGYRTIAFLPFSTNKIGSVAAIRELEPKILGFEKLFVRVNRDGSGTFDGELDGADIVELGHFAPGLQNLVRGPGGSISKTVLDPPANFHVAAGYVAEWLLNFVDQRPIADLLGRETGARLRSLHPGERSQLRFRIQALWQATDDQIAEYVLHTSILNALDQYGWSAAGLRLAADNLQDMA